MESLGEYLKKEREKRNIELKDISKKTRISVRLLHALENDDKSILPGGTFNKGFLKAYAKYLGLDETEVLTKYSQLYQSDNSAYEKYKLEIIEDIDKKPKRPLAIVIIFLVAAALFYMAYSYKKIPLQERYDTTTKKKYQNEKIAKEDKVTNKEKKPDEATPAKESVQKETRQQNLSKETPATKESVKEETLKADPGQTTPVKEAPREPSQKAAEATPVKEETQQKKAVKEAGKGHTIVFRAEAMVWMRIQIDDTDPYEVILRKGESYKRVADKKFKLKIGNAGKLRVSLDGKDLGYLGKDKEVKEVTLP